MSVYTQHVGLSLLQSRELDWDLVMQGRHVAHVLVLVNVFIIHNDLRIAREPVAAIVVDVQFLVVVPIVP